MIVATYRQTPQTAVPWTIASTCWCTQEAAASDQPANWFFHFKQQVDRDRKNHYIKSQKENKEETENL